MFSSATRRIVSATAIGIVAAEILRRLAVAVARGRTVRFDDSLRRYFSVRRRRGCDRASDIMTVLTAPALCVTISMATAFRLRQRGVAAWLPVAFSPLAAMSVGAVLSRTLPPRSAPSSQDGKSCFPSGHTTGLTAESLAIAYILEREKTVNAGSAAAILLIPLLGGMNRIYRDRHWTTDIAAGWSAGIAVASACAVVSELCRLFGEQ